ncbi:MAG: ATP-dependent DNA helicase [Acidobacteriota bacterium]
MTSSVCRNVFDEGGLLSSTYPGYERRPGQIRMSQAVAEAIAGSHHLLMEAPTGTGKTFAYLVPAIESGRRVVISTGTKNLQEQLFFKDLPILERAMQREIPAAYMKGRDNYLCIKRLRDHAAAPPLDPDGLEDPTQMVLAWSRRTVTGDRAELADLPEDSRFWHRVNARADTCLGQRCPDFEPCFLTQMRRRAAESLVLVVNHHLLMADLVLKDHAFGQVIPGYSVLILDEAHVLEDVATAHLGRAISSHQVAELAGEMERAFDDAALRRRADALRRSAKEFFALIGRDGDAARDAGRFPLDPLRRDDLWLARGTALQEMLGRCEQTLREKGDADEVGTLATRAVEQIATLGLILRPEEEAPFGGAGSMVTWGEVRGRGVTLRASPIDVSGPLRQMLFQRLSTVVLTSATLAIEGSFDFVRERLGIDAAEELILDSPFDLARQAVLYIPRAFPEPRHESFMPRFIEQVRLLIAMTSGRAFLLFTSFHNLRRAREALTGSLPYPVLVQGEASRRALLERFRTTDHAVLLATASFWHGVDVQGDALSLVVIDKLPFDVPSDPIVSARIEAVRREGGEPFTGYQVPAAVIDLKQGLGRLIRSRRDRGILAVLDVRLLTRPYGRIFLNSLPPYPIVHDLEDVAKFFAAN